MNRQPPKNAPRGGMGPRRGPGAQMMREKPKNAKKTLGRLLRYIGANKYILFVLMGIVLTVTALSLASPAIQALIINNLANGKGKIDFPELYKLLILLAVIYAVSAVFAYLQGIFAARLSASTVLKMRNDLFSRMVRLPMSFIDSHQHGDIMSRMTNDVENISNTISQSISSLFSSALTLIGSFVLMLCYSWQLTLVALITIPLTILLSTRFARVMRKLFSKQQKTLGELNGQIEEAVTGYETIVAYSREKSEIDKFYGISSELKKVAIKAQACGSIMGPLMNVIGNLGFILISAFGGYFYLSGAIASIGTIKACLDYSKQFNRPINELANQYSSIMTAIAGAERVFEIMDTSSEIDEGKLTLEESSAAGRIDFDHIEFAYKKDEPVLNDFDLHVENGQKIAIVGKTGAGKTTIVNLLTRFYEIDGGKISIGGTPICDFTKDSLRENIAIVLQDTVLFNDTIKNNIRYGTPDATDEQIIAAARTANADVFIERLPNGYDTVLAESGSNLSQGQRQLITIARAVLSDPKILILDEATSSVDTRTEMNIQTAMNRLMTGRTSLIIAHRLSTIRDADKIIVVADGRIAESGNHEELIEKKGVYYNLYQTQYAGFNT